MDHNFVAILFRQECVFSTSTALTLFSVVITMMSIWYSVICNFNSQTTITYNPLLSFTLKGVKISKHILLMIF